jgi:hypothetical protein
MTVSRRPPRSPIAAHNAEHFRPASRRGALGEHAVGGRRDGGLKMRWAKPPGCGDIYGYRLPTQSLKGFEAARGDEGVGALDGRSFREKRLSPR